MRYGSFGRKLLEAIDILYIDSNNNSVFETIIYLFKLDEDSFNTYIVGLYALMFPGNALICWGLNNELLI